MPIAFDSTRWKKVKENYTRWWSRELDRPLIPIVSRDRDPGRPQPDTPLLAQTTCADLSIPAERLIDRIDYELSCLSFHGDAFPYFNMDCFGPGIVAAFLGAVLDNSSGRVWFYPPEPKPIEELHFRFDPGNVWFRRLSDIYQAGMRRWQGQVLMGMADLGGVMDILSTFRPGEELLLDLYDAPEEVARLMREAHTAWDQAYDALNGILQPLSPGYSNWSRLYSSTPSYILQCDFSYMISPEMFDRFAKDDLAASCAKLSRSIYHLDGPGELGHLDSILTLGNLDAVQWVPGAGSPDCRCWPEVYRKISAAHKNMQVLGGSGSGPEAFDILDTVIGQTGSARGIQFVHHPWASGQIKAGPDLLGRLSAYGIE